MVMRLLHGTLHVTIYEVDKLHSSGNAPSFCRKTVNAHKYGGSLCSQTKRLVLCQPETAGSKLYATIDLDKARVGQTRAIISETSNIQWQESFHIYCAHAVSNVIFTVRGCDPYAELIVGRAYIPAEEIIYGREVDHWLEMLDEHHNPIKGGSKIHIKMQFFNVTREDNWSRGLKNPMFEGVPFSFFKQREGCNVTFYQDAHFPSAIDCKILLPSGDHYKHRRCWKDIFDAISNAKHLIYITGWSIYAELTLVRESWRQDPRLGITLGELLKKKADEGVRVLVLVWDDSDAVGVLKKDGLMAIHNQKSRDYFHNTNVRYVLCRRNPDDEQPNSQGVDSALFAHNQKAIVVDSEVPGGGSEKRRILSFVGGIDLCNGRYDTTEHPLFRTLDKFHKDDFHQPCLVGSSVRKGGPREPWHDIHCRLEGPVAWDVMTNFEQRWKKQVRDDSLIPFGELQDIITEPMKVYSSDDRETWNIQLFRSIDESAALGFPENPDEYSPLGLVSGRSSIVERSIQDAYIHAIRRARRFIYIEAQHFLGSSFSWRSNDDLKVEEVGALHLIPKELSLKIISKIEADEEFVVYVVIPMWPEGAPESDYVQAILDWQKRTMEMIYTDIAVVLEAKGIEKDPMEYLIFFCLGNREVRNAGEYAPPWTPDANTDYFRAQQSRRFMIYVHSNIMIVDDEYMIVGSGGINQRSMDGAMDTEIAIGGYQPHHLATNKPAEGQIHGFRMSLWLEHFGTLNKTLRTPWTQHCVQWVRAYADYSLQLYLRNSPNTNTPGYPVKCTEVGQNRTKIRSFNTPRTFSDKIFFHADVHSHLLLYPIKVTKEGKVEALPWMEYFPDTEARILGTKCDGLPSILTT